MGGWVLEVAKMALYVSFPVGLFHYFNLPGNIEEDLSKTRQEYINRFVGNEQFEQRRQEIAERKMKLIEKKNRVDE